MSVRNKSNASLFIRGGETWRHKVAMFVQNLLAACAISVAIAVMIYGYSVFMLTNATQRAYLQYMLVAQAEVALRLDGNRFLDRTLVVPLPDGRAVNYGTKAPWEIVRLLEPDYGQVAKLNAVAVLVGVVSFFASLKLVSRHFKGVGEKGGQEEHIRGSRLLTHAELTTAVKKSTTGAGRYTFGGVPVPAGMEMLNFLATGGMGSGKSVALLGLADQVAARGKKMIVFDKTGEFVETFYRDGKDIILNPFDTRYPGWNVFSEIEAVYEFERIAHSLIPDPEDRNASAAYFTAGARTVFYSVLQKLHAQGRRRTQEVADVLLSYSPKKMAEFLEGTPASAYISPRAAEQAAGVLSTLVGAIQVLKHVPDGDFSIREWVRRDDDCRLFITSHETIHQVVRPLIHMFVDVAIRSAMSRERVRDDKLWIFLDECASLGAMPILKESLTEARKYGVCHVLGLQNVAQLQANFGQDVTKTLRSNLQNFLILRVTDEDTQEAYSKLLGDKEIDEQSEGQSYGAAANRDGENVQSALKEKRIVLRSELGLLPDCTGYLKLAGAFDVAKVSYTYKSRPKVADGFIRRPDLLLANQPVPAAVAAGADPDTGELPCSLYDDDELLIATEPVPTPPAKAYTLDDF